MLPNHLFLISIQGISGQKKYQYIPFLLSHTRGHLVNDRATKRISECLFQGVIQLPVAKQAENYIIFKIIDLQSLE